MKKVSLASLALLSMIGFTNLAIATGNDDDDRKEERKCEDLAGHVYISNNFQALNPDNGVADEFMNVILTIHEDHTFTVTQSVDLEDAAFNISTGFGADGMSTQPIQGKWVCHDGLWYGAGFSHFSYAPHTAPYTFDEFTRYTYKICPKTHKLEFGWISFDATEVKNIGRHSPEALFKCHTENGNEVNLCKHEEEGLRIISKSCVRKAKLFREENVKELVNCDHKKECHPHKHKK